MKSQAAIQRQIKDDMNKREQRQNPDPKDFLMRRYILEFAHAQEEAERIYDITVKEVLLLTYPDYFETSQEKFQPKASLEESKRATLYRAFGYALPASSSAPIDFKIKPDRFDFEQLDLLFAQDKACIWLALKEAIPVGTHSGSVPVGKSIHRVLNDNRIEYKTIDKVKNYLALAQAFRAGTSSQVGQSVKQAASIVATVMQSATKAAGIDLAKKASTQTAKIVTPGYDSGINSCIEMIKRAIECANNDAECIGLLIHAIQPTTDWNLHTTIHDTIVPRIVTNQIQTLIQSDLIPTLDENIPDNLGDWIMKSAQTRCALSKGIELIEQFEENLSTLHAKDLAPQTLEMAVEVDTKMPASAVRGTQEQLNQINKIISSNRNNDPHSSKGQRLEVAQAVQDYLQGHHHNWLIICDAKHRNPDWHTPENVFKMFGNSPLKTLMEQIESTDENALEGKNLYKNFTELTKHINDASATALLGAIRGSSPAISTSQLFTIKGELRQALSTGSKNCRELESALEDIQLYIKNNKSTNQSTANKTAIR